MLIRILDTSNIGSDPSIRTELDMDLRRMDRLNHRKYPRVNAYRVVVTPSAFTYTEVHHRFNFELQYGMLNDGAFTPVGEPVIYSTETLPFI
ncbi:MAG: hypothetical protein HYW22_00250 [Candidatus Aenigmarchaeota archaeon]|nr:hypothetical protein [Candidatus Aenigmarchaeota archaeon]